jgi:hypothetical protein
MLLIWEANKYEKCVIIIIIIIIIIILLFAMVKYKLVRATATWKYWLQWTCSLQRKFSTANIFKKWNVTMKIFGKIKFANSDVLLLISI